MTQRQVARDYLHVVLDRYVMPNSGIVHGCFVIHAQAGNPRLSVIGIGVMFFQKSNVFEVLHLLFGR